MTFVHQNAEWLPGNTATQAEECKLPQKAAGRGRCRQAAADAAAKAAAGSCCQEGEYPEPGRCSLRLQRNETTAKEKRTRLVAD